jgi:hypothetical protein
MSYIITGTDSHPPPEQVGQTLLAGRKIGCKFRQVGTRANGHKAAVSVECHYRIRIGAKRLTPAAIWTDVDIRNLLPGSDDILGRLNWLTRNRIPPARQREIRRPRPSRSILPSDPRKGHGGFRVPPIEPVSAETQPPNHRDPLPIAVSCRFIARVAWTRHGARRVENLPTP